MANTIREYRENRGLTQEELAEKAHIPVELIRAIEDGKEVILPTFQAESISKALRVESSLLFDNVAEYEATPENVAEYEATPENEELEKLEEISLDLSGIIATANVVLGAMEDAIDLHVKITGSKMVRDLLSQNMDSLWYLVGQLDIIHNGI